MKDLLKKLTLTAREEKQSVKDFDNIKTIYDKLDDLKAEAQKGNGKATLWLPHPISDIVIAKAKEITGCECWVNAPHYPCHLNIKWTE